MATKQADSKGRVTLGPEFANKTLIIEEIEPGVLLVLSAVVIPEREAWLYSNNDALSAVHAGLEQAKAGQFSTSPPDLEADAELADSMGHDQ